MKRRVLPEPTLEMPEGWRPTTMTKRHRRALYLYIAHEMLANFLAAPCGTFGRGHHPAERYVADLLEVTYQGGVSTAQSRRRRWP